MTNLETITDYQQQALDFLATTNAQIEVKYLRTGKHFDDDKEGRDIYKVTLSCKGRKFTFDFGQSINDSGFYYQYKTGKTKFPLDRKYLDKDYFKGKSLGLIGTIKMKDSSFVPNLDIIHYPKAPNAYDVLCALTKYDPGSFENFCGEFGYDADSRRAEKTYKAVQNEYTQLCALFTDTELKSMQEIQ